MDARQREQLLDLINKVLTGKHNLLVNNLHHLDVSCREFEGYYAEYDLNRNTPANGFRSFCKIIGIMIQNISDICNESNPLRKNNVKILEEYTALTNLFLKQAELGKIIRSKGTDYSTFNSSDLDRKIIAKAQFTEADIAPFFGKVGFFFLRKDFQDEWQKVVWLTHYLSQKAALQKVRFLADQSFAKRMMISNSITPDLNFMRRAIDVTQFPVNLMYRWNGHKGMKFTWIDVPVDANKHVIMLTDLKKPAFIAEKHRSVRSVRCLLITPKEGRVGEHVVLHSHGGAFVGGSAQAEAPVCADRVADLGVTFLLPDYALAPEHPFPAAVQDVLDVYMFLVSGSPRVAELMGFHPKKILLSGASAGGTFSLAVTFVLNAIRKRGRTAKLLMPCGVNVQFAGAMIAFIPTPSSIVYDFMCTPPAMCLAASFYQQTEPRLTDEHWYKKADAKDTMKRLSERSFDPIYNPLAFKDWDDLRDIPLSVLACEMDVLLDQSILLLKKWSGAKDLDLAAGVPHAFINNPHVALTNDKRTVVNRMAQALKIKI